LITVIMLKCTVSQDGLLYNVGKVVQYVQYIQLPKSELQQQQLIVHAGAQQAFRGVGWLFCGPVGPVGLQLLS
jgi:hypothetical protein